MRECDLDRSLWRNADFLKLWSAQTISVAGSLLGALQFTAVLALGATPVQMSLLAASAVIPALLFGLAAGAWVDRLRRRPLLIAADIGRVALLGSIPVAWALDVLNIEQLYLVAFLHGLLTILFDVAYRSYLPSLVGRGQLVEANSRLTASASVAEVGAFSLGRLDRAAGIRRCSGDDRRGNISGLRADAGLDPRSRARPHSA